MRRHRQTLAVAGGALRQINGEDKRSCGGNPYRARLRRITSHRDLKGMGAHPHVGQVESAGFVGVRPMPGRDQLHEGIGKRRAARGVDHLTADRARDRKRQRATCGGRDAARANYLNGIPRTFDRLEAVRRQQLVEHRSGRVRARFGDDVHLRRHDLRAEDDSQPSGRERPQRLGQPSALELFGPTLRTCWRRAHGEQSRQHQPRTDPLGSREGVKFSVDLPPTVTEFEVPTGVINLGKEFKFEIIARAATGNNTAVESCFRVN
jgi:hypothetical protein